MNGTTYVASLKYSPIMWNHSRAIGEPARACGQRVRYLLDAGYAWMLETPNIETELIDLPGSSNPILHGIALHRRGGARQIREAFAEAPPSTLVFVNLNPFVDRAVIRLARAANPGVRIVALLHEPHATNKAVYGWKRALLLHVFEQLSRRMANLCDAVILPSENARAVFDQFYRRFRGEVRVIPLAFADERCDEERERRYVTFVGHIAHAHQKGLDLFIEMVEASTGRGDEYAFQLVTSEDPSAVVEALSPAARARLKVVHDERLSDRAISCAIRESVAVALLQRRVMQSGVVPMAMMNGTPIIASDLPGLTQFVESGKTGWVVPVEPGLDARFEAIDAVRSRLPEMEVACRKRYEETFDSRCVRPHIPWIVGEAKRS